MVYELGELGTGLAGLNPLGEDDHGPFGGHCGEVLGDDLLRLVGALGEAFLYFVVQDELAVLVGGGWRDRVAGELGELFKGWVHFLDVIVGPDHLVGVCERALATELGRHESDCGVGVATVVRELLEWERNWTEEVGEDQPSDSSVAKAVLRVLDEVACS